jgi:hypothetical protein
MRLKYRRARLTRLMFLPIVLWGCTAYSAEDMLSLRELHTLQVPNEFDLAGATLSSSGAILAWSKSAPMLLVAVHGKWTTLEYPSVFGPLAARFLSDDSHIEVLDPGAARLVQMDIMGAVSGETFLGSFADSLFLVSATPIGSSWGIAGRDRAGDIRIYYKEPKKAAVLRGVVRRADYAAFLPDTSATLNVYLTPSKAGDGMLVTLQWFPFRTLLLSSRAERLSFAPGVLSVLPAGPMTTSGSTTQIALASLPTVALDHGFLQVVTDLKSDSRVLIRYDVAGRVRNQLHLDVPIGILQSIPDERHLLAVRRRPGFELVEYEWHWSRKSGNLTQE